MNLTQTFVEVNELRLHVLCWSENADRPPAILVAGTGFPALTWRVVAERLATEYVVYALDRRGHGLSDKSEPVSTGSGLGYDFADFAADLIGVMDALGVRGAYGIGHSAGGTDVLLAAGQRPDLFSRVMAMEPPIRDAALPESSSANFNAESAMRQRRSEFDSRPQVFARYGSRPPFNVWRASVLWDYVEAGFEDLPDGRVRLRCRPALEAEMAVAIGAVMMQNRIADGLSDPFPLIEQISCPVLLTTGGLSRAVFQRMSQAAARMISGAALRHLADATHFVPMQLPEEVVRLAREFARGHYQLIDLPSAPMT